MNNCTDCNTPLKHLFGPKWFCPNDCDRKPKDLGYEISFMPMWNTSVKENYLKGFSIRPLSSRLFYDSIKEYIKQVTSSVYAHRYEVLSGSYKQEIYSIVPGRVLITNPSKTDTLIIVRSKP